jgi:aquaporin Z
VEQRSLNAYVAEFLGTFLLVFAISLIVTLFVNAAGTNSDWTVASLAQGLVLLTLVATLGTISGGHFNPAVTIGAALLRKINPTDGAMYVIVQLIGAILGVWLTKYILDDALADTVNLGAGSLQKDLLAGNAAGLVAEAVGTFFLVWAVVAMTMSPKAPVHGERQVERGRADIGCLR